MEENSEVVTSDDKIRQLVDLTSGQVEEDLEPVVETAPETEAEAAPVEEQPQEDPAELKRRLDQLEHSYREARVHIQQKGEQYNRLQTELVAKDVLLEELRKGRQAPPEPPPNLWQAAGIEDVQTAILTEPGRVLAAQAQDIERRLSQQYDEKLANQLETLRQDLAQAETQKQRVLSMVDAAEKARAELGLDLETWQVLLNSVGPMIKADAGENGYFDPQQYVTKARSFIGRIAPTPTATPVQGNPPGSKRAASAANPQPAEPSLSPADRAIANMFRQANPGLSDDFENKVAARLTELRRSR